MSSDLSSPSCLLVLFVALKNKYMVRAKGVVTRWLFRERPGPRVTCLVTCGLVAVQASAGLWMMAGDHLQPKEKRNECLAPVQGQ